MIVGFAAQMLHLPLLVLAWNETRLAGFACNGDYKTNWFQRELKRLDLVDPLILVALDRPVNLDSRRSHAFVGQPLGCNGAVVLGSRSARMDLRL